MSEQKSVYFISQLEHDENGYVPCIAVYGEKGYHRTDWHWDCTLEEAEKICDEKNARLGFGRKEAFMIVLSTMDLEGDLNEQYNFFI